MRKLATVGLSYAAAIFLSCYLVPWKHQISAGIIALAAMAPAIFLKGNTRLRVILVSSGFAAGFLWNAGYNTVFLDPSRALAGTTQIIEGRAEGFSDEHGFGMNSVTVRITGAGLPGAKVWLRYWGGLELEPGDIVRAEVEFYEAQTLDYYLSRGYSTDSYLMGTAIEEIEHIGRSRLSFLYFPLYLAREIKIKTLELWPGDVSHFMISLLTGDTELLYDDDALSLAMSRAGLLHIVSVSGTHVSFLVGFASMFFRRRKRAVAVCVPIIVTFAVMTGMNPPVIRASLMQIFVLIAPLISREADSLTSFSAVLTLLLIINPAAGYNVGLQLSFASILGIILFSQRMRDAILKYAGSKKHAKKKSIAAAIRFLGDSFSSTIGALVFTTPLAAVYFGYVPLYSPITNILALGVISLLFSAGFVVCAIGALLPALGAALGTIAAFGARYVIFAVTLISDLPFSALYTSYNLAAWWIVFLYAVFAMFYATKGKEGFRPVFPVCLSSVTLFAVLFLSMFQGMRVSAVDVGQGQSIALMTETGTVVVDCGSLGGGSAGRETAEYLLSLNRGSVDLLVLTHLHSDHANGVASLLQMVDVRLIVMPLNASEDDEMLETIIAAARYSNTQVAFLTGDVGYSLGSLQLELIAPIGSGSVNERGIILLGSIKDFDFLITGDVDSVTERRLLLRRNLPELELLVAGHHGSRHSTSEELLRAVNPIVSFISVGSNGYGHPTSETLERLAKAGAEIYRTDLQGHLEIRIK